MNFVCQYFGEEDIVKKERIFLQDSKNVTNKKCKEERYNTIKLTHFYVISHCYAISAFVTLAHIFINS